MEIDYPHAILAAFATVVVLGLLVAVSTSGAAFGAYNPSWDGTSELREVADGSGTETQFIRNISGYRSLPANRTLAVVLSPDERYGLAGTRSMQEFVASGGTLLVAADFGSAGNSLLADLGADARVDGRVLRDERTHGASPAFPRATNVSDHSLTTGVEQLTLNHGSSVTTIGEETTNGSDSNVTTLVATSPFAYHDGNGNGQLDDDESIGRYPVATVESVGDGQIIVVSDPSLFINTMLDKGDNRAFATNLVSSHDRLAIDISHTSSLPPLTALLISLRESTLAQVLIGVVLILAITRWEWLSSVVYGILDRRKTPYSESIDRDAIVAGVRERHPEWDLDRIERVTQGIMTTKIEDSGDD